MDIWCQGFLRPSAATNVGISETHGSAEMNVAIIDFEFTGLDSEYITDNEIIQAKIRHLGTGKAALANFGSDKPLTAHVRLTHKVERYEGDPFSSGAWAA